MKKIKLYCSEVAIIFRIRFYKLNLKYKSQYKKNNTYSKKNSECTNIFNTNVFFLDLQ